jgi:putative flippase GtrA
MIGRQVLRWIAVGVSLNAALYGVYLLLSRALMGSVAAMTLTYAIGVLLGFTLNRSIIFRFVGDNGAALVRYCLAYAAGYVIDFGALRLLSGGLGIPHEIVQGAMVALLAIGLFALQRYWVFRPRREGPTRGPGREPDAMTSPTSHEPAPPRPALSAEISDGAGDPRIRYRSPGPSKS